MSLGFCGDDICLRSSLLAGGMLSWSMLSSLNLLQSLITPFGPVVGQNTGVLKVINASIQALYLDIMKNK